jgi:DNA-binding response OmpR family regulator
MPSDFNHRILVVDDEPSIRDIVVRYLADASSAAKKPSRRVG